MNVIIIIITVVVVVVVRHFGSRLKPPSSLFSCCCLFIATITIGLIIYLPCIIFSSFHSFNSVPVCFAVVLFPSTISFLSLRFLHISFALCVVSAQFENAQIIYNSILTVKRANEREREYYVFACCRCRVYACAMTKWTTLEVEFIAL